MSEFIFKTAKHIEWQKWLNQWKHKYELIIHATSIDGENATILLERKDK